MLFVGRKAGMEYELVTKAGFDFAHLEVSGLQRSLSPKNMARNVGAAWHLALAPAASKKILNAFKPDFAMGFGGYVSLPTIKQAAKMGVKTAIHEQNAFPGITNKYLAKYVDAVFIAMSEAAARMAAPQKIVVCGNPVRADMLSLKKAACKKQTNTSGKKLVLSFGGSLGSTSINDIAAHIMAANAGDSSVVHVHATGKANYTAFMDTLMHMAVKIDDSIIIKEFIEDMPAYMGAADLVVCRAGAITLAELAAVGRAAVLVPSPFVAENHQYHNALEFERAGAAIIAQEKLAPPQSVAKFAKELLANPVKLEQMGKAAQTLFVADTERII